MSCIISFQICKHVLETLQLKKDVSATQTNSIISRITIEIDLLESSDLICLTDLCVESIQKADSRSTGYVQFHTYTHTLFQLKKCFQTKISLQGCETDLQYQDGKFLTGLGIDSGTSIWMWCP